MPVVRRFGQQFVPRWRDSFPPVPSDAPMTKHPCVFQDVPDAAPPPPSIHAVLALNGIATGPNPSFRTAVFLAFNYAMVNPSRRNSVLNPLAYALAALGYPLSAACVRQWM